MRNFTQFTFALGALVVATLALADSAAQRARIDFNQAIVKVDELEQKCYADLPVLAPDVFNEVSLDTEQARTVLSYFYYRALASCTEAAVSNFVLKAAVLSELSPSEREEIKDGSSLIIQPHVAVLEHEAQYIKLPPEIRIRLDRIEALRQPFDLIMSGDALLPLQDPK